MIASAIINLARRILHDENGSSYRWTDAIMFSYVNEAQRDLYSKRPEFWLGATGTIASVVPVTATSTDLTIAHDRLTPYLAAYVCYKALSEDDADAENLKRAMTQRQQYEEVVR